MRWRAHIDYLTAAKELRHWDCEVEAHSAADACELAAQAFQLSRSTPRVPEIADIHLEEVEET